MSKLNEEKKNVAGEQVGKEKKPAVQEQATPEPDIYIGAVLRKYSYPM